MAEITPEAVSKRLAGDGDEFLLLDIRSADEYESWHIPGSEHIDVYDELKSDPQLAAAALSTLPRSEEIVTVCTAGVVSRTATEVLREQGYDAKTLTDGMNGWSRVHRSDSVPVEIAGTLIQVTRPGKGCLSYVLISGGEAAVVDPSHYIEEYEDVLDEYDADLVAVLDTHAHADHVSGGRELADRYGVPYYLHPKDALAVEATSLEDGQRIEVGAVDVEAIHTPGHSEGSVTFGIDGEALVTGDTFFYESVGRVELGVSAGIEDFNVQENAVTLYESLQRLLERPDDTVVLPAHDPGSPEPPVVATLGEVKARNEDLGRDRAEFIEILASDIPEHPPNFERVKRVNVGQEAVPREELSTLELGPNRCAASE